MSEWSAKDVLLRWRQTVPRAEVDPEAQEAAGPSQQAHDAGRQGKLPEVLELQPVHAKSPATVEDK